MGLECLLVLFFLVFFGDLFLLLVFFFLGGFFVIFFLFVNVEKGINVFFGIFNLRFNGDIGIINWIKNIFDYFDGF